MALKSSVKPNVASSEGFSETSDTSHAIEKTPANVVRGNMTRLWYEGSEPLHAWIWHSIQALRVMETM